MQKEFIKNIYKEFVYCDPNDHLLNPNNTLTRPETSSWMPKLGERNNSKHMLNKVSQLNNPQFVTIQSEITGDNNNSEITVVSTKPDVKQLVTPKLQETTSSKPIKTEEEVIHTQSLETSSRKKKSKDEPIIYSEEVFNQIELRGFITKDLLRMSLDKGSNLFHIAEEIFEKLVDRYNQFKEILHTLETEFDNTVECIIETGKELGKKINHIIYQLYLAIMNRRL